MSFSFVTCTDVNCSFNEGKACRAPFLFVNENGECKIKDEGPFENKSFVDAYVEVKECLCDKCQFWEKKYINDQEVGSCGYGSDLAFDIQRDVNGAVYVELPPRCTAISRQVEETGFSMTA